MQRYLFVRGKPGVPVTNPHTPHDPLRFVGQKRIVEFDEKQHLSLMDLYEPCDDVVLDHPDLGKPIRRGDLTILGKVGMRDLESAREYFARNAKTVEAPKPKASRAGRDE